MSVWVIVTLIIICILIGILIGKICILKLSFREINETLKMIQSSETNALISISSKDRDVLKLVEELNKSLIDIRSKELKYKNGNYETQLAISNVAHDLRTPLTAILGYTELLEKENFSNKSVNYLNIIKTRTKDLIYLSDQLFDFMQQKEQIEIKMESVCLNQELEATLFSYYGLFKEKGIEPKIKITPIKVYRSLNKEMLRRIFDNIIYNAIKYGGNELIVSLTLSGKIIFSNPAKGLDVVGVQKIFDRYYTLENARKTSGGAGLSIVKQFVEMNQGKITAKLEKDWLILTLEFGK